MDVAVTCLPTRNRQDQVLSPVVKVTHGSSFDTTDYLGAYRTLELNLLLVVTVRKQPLSKGYSKTPENLHDL